MVYAYPTNVTSFPSLATYVNTVTLDWFWTLTIISIFIMTFVALNNTNSKETTITVAAFIAVILSGLLRVLDLVNDTLLFFFVVVMAVGLMMMHLRNRVV